MKISPFTPLNFADANPSDGLRSRYVQVFAPTDRIMVQILATNTETAPTVKLNDAHTGTQLALLSVQSWAMNAEKTLFFLVLEGLSIGHYSITVTDAIGHTLDATCDEFRVTDDASVLAKTTLIQYRFRDNKQRDDVVSIIDYMPYFFDFRVPGGFKDGGWGFGVSNEQFSTQREDLVELYAYDYTTKTFTLGGSIGVPVWYGEMLNRLLTCSYVYLNGERYVRNESEVPQLNTLVEGLDSFVFTQVLRRSHIGDEATEEENQIAIRRAVGSNFDTNRTTLDNDDENDNFVLIS